MEVAQYLTVAAFAAPQPLALTFRPLGLNQDAPVALTPDSSFFEDARQGTLKKPFLLPTQGASGR